MAVMGNLWKVQKKWALMLRILEEEGSYVSSSGTFFKDVVQEVLLFRSEIWVTTPHMGKKLGEPRTVLPVG